MERGVDSAVVVYKLEMEDLFDSEEQFRVLEEIVQVWIVISV